jgi:polysaccharide export outer membrane protein
MKRLIGASLGLLLCACSGSPHPQQGIVRPAGDSIAPELLVADLTNAKIESGDQLAVQVYREPELSLAAVTVDPAGNIEMPLTGSTAVAGLTAAQLSGRIQTDMARFVVSPRVTVNITAYNSRTFTVEGEVNNPGVFQYQNGMTLLSAIAVAKSPTPIARTAEVSVIRTTPTGRYLGVFDLEAIRAGRMSDIQLQPKDYVVVGRSGRREFWRGFLQVAPLVGLFTKF